MSSAQTPISNIQGGNQAPAGGQKRYRRRRGGSQNMNKIDGNESDAGSVTSNMTTQSSSSASRGNRNRRGSRGGRGGNQADKSGNNGGESQSYQSTERSKQYRGGRNRNRGRSDSIKSTGALASEKTVAALQPVKEEPAEDDTKAKPIQDTMVPETKKSEVNEASTDAVQKTEDQKSSTPADQTAQVEEHSSGILQKADDKDLTAGVEKAGVVVKSAETQGPTIPKDDSKTKSAGAEPHTKAPDGDDQEFKQIFGGMSREEFREKTIRLRKKQEEERLAIISPPRSEPDENKVDAKVDANADEPVETPKQENLAPAERKEEDKSQTPTPPKNQSVPMKSEAKVLGIREFKMPAAPNTKPGYVSVRKDPATGKIQAYTITEEMMMALEYAKQWGYYKLCEIGMSHIKKEDVTFHVGSSKSQGYMFETTPGTRDQIPRAVLELKNLAALNLNISWAIGRLLFLFEHGRIRAVRVNDTGNREVVVNTGSGRQQNVAPGTIILSVVEMASTVLEKSGFKIQNEDISFREVDTRPFGYIWQTSPDTDRRIPHQFQHIRLKDVRNVAILRQLQDMFKLDYMMVCKVDQAPKTATGSVEGFVPLPPNFQYQRERKPVNFTNTAQKGASSTAATVVVPLPSANPTSPERPSTSESKRSEKDRKEFEEIQKRYKQNLDDMAECPPHLKAKILALSTPKDSPESSRPISPEKAQVVTGNQTKPQEEIKTGDETPSKPIPPHMRTRTQSPKESQRGDGASSKDSSSLKDSTSPKDSPSSSNETTKFTLSKVGRVSDETALDRIVGRRKFVYTMDQDPVELTEEQKRRAEEFNRVQEAIRKAGQILPNAGPNGWPARDPNRKPRCKVPPPDPLFNDRRTVSSPVRFKKLVKDAPPPRPSTADQTSAKQGNKPETGAAFTQPKQNMGPPAPPKDNKAMSRTPQPATSGTMSKPPQTQVTVGTAKVTDSAPGNSQPVEVKNNPLPPHLRRAKEPVVTQQVATVVDSPKQISDDEQGKQAEQAVPVPVVAEEPAPEPRQEKTATSVPSSDVSVQRAELVKEIRELASAALHKHLGIEVRPEQILFEDSKTVKAGYIWKAKDQVSSYHPILQKSPLDKVPNILSLMSIRDKLSEGIMYPARPTQSPSDGSGGVPLGDTVIRNSMQIMDRIVQGEEAFAASIETPIPQPAEPEVPQDIDSIVQPIVDEIVDDAVKSVEIPETPIDSATTLGAQESHVTSAHSGEVDQALAEAEKVHGLDALDAPSDAKEPAPAADEADDSDATSEATSPSSVDDQSLEDYDDEVRLDESPAFHTDGDSDSETDLYLQDLISSSAQDDSDVDSVGSVQSGHDNVPVPTILSTAELDIPMIQETQVSDSSDSESSSKMSSASGVNKIGDDFPAFRDLGTFDPSTNHRLKAIEEARKEAEFENEIKDIMSGIRHEFSRESFSNDRVSSIPSVGTNLHVPTGGPDDMEQPVPSIKIDETQCSQEVDSVADEETSSPGADISGSLSSGLSAAEGPVAQPTLRAEDGNSSDSEVDPKETASINSEQLKAVGPPPSRKPEFLDDPTYPERAALCIGRLGQENAAYQKQLKVSKAEVEKFRRRFLDAKVHNQTLKEAVVSRDKALKEQENTIHLLSEIIEKRNHTIALMKEQAEQREKDLMEAKTELDGYKARLGQITALSVSLPQENKSSEELEGPKDHKEITAKEPTLSDDGASVISAVKPDIASPQKAEMFVSQPEPEVKEVQAPKESQQLQSVPEGNEQSRSAQDTQLVKNHNAPKGLRSLEEIYIGRDGWAAGADPRFSKRNTVGESDFSSGTSGPAPNEIDYNRHRGARGWRGRGFRGNPRGSYSGGPPHHQGSRMQGGQGYQGQANENASTFSRPHRNNRGHSRGRSRQDSQSTQRVATFKDYGLGRVYHTDHDGRVKEYNSRGSRYANLVEATNNGEAINWNEPNAFVSKRAEEHAWDEAYEQLVHNPNRWDNVETTETTERIHKPNKWVREPKELERNDKPMWEAPDYIFADYPGGVYPGDTY